VRASSRRSSASRFVGAATDFAGAGVALIAKPVPEGGKRKHWLKFLNCAFRHAAARSEAEVNRPEGAQRRRRATDR